jgi:hypothetical protein
MTYRTIYSDADFPQMGWHDATVYSMMFPTDDFSISFDIDYIFKWHRTGAAFSGWDVAPCTLKFENVSKLKVALDWSLPDNMLLNDTSFMDIRRQNMQPSPNGKVVCWDYEIELDVGVITFNATGFEQVVRVPPIFCESQQLGRSR